MRSEILNKEFLIKKLKVERIKKLLVRPKVIDRFEEDFWKGLRKKFIEIGAQVRKVFDRLRVWDELWEEARKVEKQDRLERLKFEWESEMRESFEDLSDWLFERELEGYNLGGKIGLIKIGVERNFFLRERKIIEEIKERANKLGADIRDKVCWEDMRKLLYRGYYLEGKNPIEMRREVAKLFEEEIPLWRGKRIARTETLVVTESAIYETMKRNGVEKKQWITHLDERTRDAHRLAHGQVVGIEEYFEVGGELLRYPGDPQGSPENIVNCRCDMLPVIEEFKTRDKIWDGSWEEFEVELKPFKVEIPEDWRVVKLIGAEGIEEEVSDLVMSFIPMKFLEGIKSASWVEGLIEGKYFSKVDLSGKELVFSKEMRKFGKDKMIDLGLKSFGMVSFDSLSEQLKEEFREIWKRRKKDLFLDLDSGSSVEVYFGNSLKNFIARPMKLKKREKETFEFFERLYKRRVR